MPRMTGKRAMIEHLMADGVRRIFGNPGTTEQGFMDAGGPSLVDVVMESPVPIP